MKKIVCSFCLKDLSEIAEKLAPADPESVLDLHLTDHMRSIIGPILERERKHNDELDRLLKILGCPKKYDIEKPWRNL